MSKSNPSEKELKEKLNQVGKDISKISADKKLSYEQAIIRAERSLLMINSEGLKTGFEHIDSHLKQLLEKIFDPLSESYKSSEMKTGLSDLDNVLEGFHSGNLYIIGGSPGMGKTALVLTIMCHAAVQQKATVGIFSLDLTAIQIAFRLLCLEAKVDSHILRTGNLPKTQWNDIESSVAVLAETSIFIDDMKSLSPLKMKHNAIRLKAEHDIKLLIIDNNQVIHKRDMQHLPCRLLKQMAVELEIPLIVISPLIRKPEERKNKRPLLSDFRRAVEIEESADTIMLLYRPWIDTLDEVDRELAEVIIAKNRNGPTGYVNLRFIEKYAGFEND